MQDAEWGWVCKWCVRRERLVVEDSLDVAFVEFFGCDPLTIIKSNGFVC